MPTASPSSSSTRIGPRNAGGDPRRGLTSRLTLGAIDVYRVHNRMNTNPIAECENIWGYLNDLRRENPPHPRDSPRRLKVEQRSEGGNWVEVGTIHHHASCDVEYVPIAQQPSPAA